MARTFIFIFMSLSLWSTTAHAQKNQVSGTVLGLEEDSTKVPVPGATVVWKGTTIGALTDKNGKFKLQQVEETDKLIISAFQFVTDTFDISQNSNYQFILSRTVNLKEFEVSSKEQSTKIDYMNPIKVEKMGEDELMKAACCNLSESFETSPSVDVSFSDAVTGTRQIEMLGLAGPNTQIMRENMPNVRGLSALYGLTFTPGTWIKSIQLNKGTGSVVNGYESIAGQINTELRKPESTHKLYLNLYANEGSRFEANAHSGIRITDSLSTAILVHAKTNQNRFDRNDDNFLDMPVGELYTVANRWKYRPNNAWVMQAGIKGTMKESTSGQENFNRNEHKGGESVWGMALDIKRLDGWYKLGYINPNRKQQSIALQLSGAIHQQRSYFGSRRYDADQKSGYANFIYQDFLGNTNHKLRAGASLMYDYYDEVLTDQVYEREEIIPGVYSEYTFTQSDQLSLVFGLRADHHNQFGFFATPRFHSRWAITEKTILRASAGRGQRHPAIFAEHNGLLASNREFVIETDDNPDNTLYGLKPEVAWNYGLSLTQDFTLDYRDGYFSIDLYRTDFINQIVVDFDRSPQQAVFYNLKGKSYSNSFQALVSYEVIRRLNAKVAYRFFDVKTTYSGEIRQKPLVAQQRAFLNLEYETPSFWSFDLTVNRIGQKRLPITSSNPKEYQLDEKSSSYWTVNTQVSKTWKDFDLYVGAENLLNYRQPNPILASDEPFSDYFDASMVWGPVFGRVAYIGFRYKLK